MVDSFSIVLMMVLEMEEHLHFLFALLLKRNLVGQFTPDTMEENTLLRLAEIEVSYKPKIKPSERIPVTSSADAEKVFRMIWGLPMEHRESFYALYLNRANKALGYYLVSVGGISGTVVDPRIIFQTGLKANASSVIIAHCHPSGNRYPSDADKLITKKLKETGEIVEIRQLDHLILMPEGYTSLDDDGAI